VPEYTFPGLHDAPPEKGKEKIKEEKVAARHSPVRLVTFHLQPMYSTRVKPEINYDIVLPPEVRRAFSRPIKSKKPKRHFLTWTILVLCATSLGAIIVGTYGPRQPVAHVPIPQSAPAQPKAPGGE